MKALRAPALHFLLLGAALFAGERAFAPPPRERVVVSPAQLARIADEARRETGHEPGAEDLARRVDAWVGDELLIRRALALGWSRSDPVVQRRLLANLGFLAPEEEAGDDAQRLERAYALGMDRSDAVVRRRLLERMELAVAAAARAREPDDAELAALLAREPERFRRPARVSLAQVFVSRDRHGARLEAAARARAAQLRGRAVRPEDAAAWSDPLLVPSRFARVSERSLAARLGAEFARRVFALEPGRWSDPVASAYGLHLVWVETREPAVDATVEEARRELRAAWFEEREARTRLGAMAALRRDADVRVERR